MSVNWREQTAVFGGAFDPPHLGHREAVEGLLREPGVRRVIVLPAGNPPLKSTGTAAEHRLAMTKLNFARLKEGLSMRVEIDEREVRRAIADPNAKPSYTIDTLQDLKRDVGPALAFVIGVDQIEALEKWHRVRELLGLCHWIAIEREDEATDAQTRMANGLKRLQALGLLRTTGNPREWETLGGTRLLSVPTEARASSSTEIRRRFARGGNAINPHISSLFIGQNGPESLPAPATENLHPDVESYLMAHHLYGT
ncbi:MAG: nicotinate-nicotinamide nucleotide adenylyltransferase [Bdellovibrionales bacterium]|nr:nicotinate-nicotinamide nucleotide adenylyltransferase [Bdellovibrionales bacterium]